MSKTKRYRIRKALGGEKPGVINKMQQFMLKAEQGMQQPSPEEMAMMQQQQQEQMLQQQGAGQPQENSATAAIMQGMEENVTPPNIIMQLLSSGVSEDDIVRGFVEVSLAKLQQSGQEVDQQMTQEMLTQFEDLVGMVSLKMQEGSQEQPMQEQPAEMSKGGYKKKLLKEAKEGREMQTETPGSILPQPATLNNFIEGVKNEGNEFYAKEMADMNYSDESEMFRKGGEKWKTRRVTNRGIARRASKQSPYERSDRKALRKGLKRGDFTWQELNDSIYEGKSVLPPDYNQIRKDMVTIGSDYLGSMMPQIFSHRNTANEFSRKGTGLEDTDVDIYFKKKGLGRREWGISGLDYTSLPGFGGTLGTSGVGTTRTIGTRVIPGVTATQTLIKDINDANDDSDRALKLKNNPPNDEESQFRYFERVLNGDQSGDSTLMWDSTANKWVKRPKELDEVLDKHPEEFDVDVTSDSADDTEDPEYAQWEELLNSNPPTVGQTYDEWCEDNGCGINIPQMKEFVWDGNVWKKKEDNDDGASTDIETQTDPNDPNAEAKEVLGPNATEEDIANYNEEKRIEALQNQENVNVDEVLNNIGYEVVADNEVTEVSADNFGVTDDMTFSQAYRTAKDAGATTFTWQGKEYGTKSFSEMPEEYQDEHRDSKWHPDNVAKSKEEKTLNAWMKKAPPGGFGGYGWDEIGEGGTADYVEGLLKDGYSKEEIINDILEGEVEDREDVRKWLDSYPGWRENTMEEKKKRAKEINEEATEQNKKVLDNKHTKNAKTKEAAIEYFKRAYPDYTKNPKKYKIVDKGNGRWNLDRAAGGNMKQYSPSDYNRSAFPNLAFGGSITPDLYKYVYGGDEMDDPDMYKDVTDPYFAPGGAFKKPKMDPVLGPGSPSAEVQKYRETVYPTSKGVFGQIKDHFKTGFEPITQGQGLKGVFKTMGNLVAPKQFDWLSHKSGGKDAAFGYIGVDGLPNTIAQPYGSAQFDIDGNRIIGSNINLKYKDKKIGKDRLNVTWTPNKNTFDDDGKIDSSEYEGFKDYYTGKDSGFLNKDNFNEGGQNIYSGLDKFFMAGEIDTDFMGDQDTPNMNLVENASDDDFNLEDCTEAELQEVGSDCYNAAVKSEKFKVNTARKTNNPLIANMSGRLADFIVDRGTAEETRRQEEFDRNKQTSDAKVSNISTDISQGFDSVTGYQPMAQSLFNNTVESSSARPSSINYFGARGGQYRVGGVYNLTPQQIDAIYAAGGSIEIIE